MSQSFLLNELRVLTPLGLEAQRSIVIEDGRIAEITGASDTLGKSPDVAFPFRRCTALPGLINIHDHLVGTWAPKAGEGLYANIYQWLEYYERHPVRLERMSIPDVQIVALGGYRNLISGVTTVVDHYFRLPKQTYDGSPIRVVTSFGREWVLASATNPSRWNSWGEGISDEIAATEGKTPFIIHISEGIDDIARAELRKLNSLGAVKSNTVLVHCIGFSREDIEIVRKAGAKIVWCPSSNHFLYGDTLDASRALDSGINVSIGTDSTVTGSENLLREMQYAKKAFLEKHFKELEAETVFRMATINPAKALMMDSLIGTIEKGKSADIVIIEDQGQNPFEALLSMDSTDLDLVIHRGIPAFGKPKYRPLFERLSPHFTEVKIKGQARLIAGDPAALVRDIFRQLGYEKRLDFFEIAL